MRGDGGDPVIELLAEEWQRLAELVAPLSPQEWMGPTDCPSWTVADQIGHVIGTESLLAGLERPPAPEEVTSAAHVHNPIGAVNEAWIHSLRSLSKDEVLARFDAITSQRLAALRAMGDEDLDRVGPSPVGQVPYRTSMDVRLMDCWAHEQDIRRAVGQPGHMDGPIAARAMGRLASAMPFVVVRRAGAPDGTVLLFDLTGEGARRLGVTVDDGKGRSADAGEIDDQTTVCLTMDASTWCSLALGRITGAAARDGGLVHVQGDAELGTRVLDAMGFMI